MNLINLPSSSFLRGVFASACFCAVAPALLFAPLVAAAAFSLGLLCRFLGSGSLTSAWPGSRFTPRPCVPGTTSGWFWSGPCCGSEAGRTLVGIGGGGPRMIPPCEVNKWNGLLTNDRVNQNVKERERKRSYKSLGNIEYEGDRNCN